jgi:hypothetical protein
MPQRTIRCCSTACFRCSELLTDDERAYYGVTCEKCTRAEWGALIEADKDVPQMVH